MAPQHSPKQLSTSTAPPLATTLPLLGLLSRSVPPVVIQPSSGTVPLKPGKEHIWRTGTRTARGVPTLRRGLALLLFLLSHNGVLARGTHVRHRSVLYADVSTTSVNNPQVSSRRTFLLSIPMPLPEILTLEYLTREHRTVATPIFAGLSVRVIRVDATHMVSTGVVSQLVAG